MLRTINLLGKEKSLSRLQKRKSLGFDTKYVKKIRENFDSVTIAKFF